MPEEFPELRRLLDAVPAPEPAPVDLAALYRTAFDRQIQRSRRWRRFAFLGAALAAGILLVALLPKLEIRCDSTEFAIRWGIKPEPTAPQTDPRIEELWRERQRQTDALRVTNSNVQTLEDLLLTLAADVDQRDKKQLARLNELRSKLKEFESSTAKQIEGAERSNLALYNVVFNTKPKSGATNP